MLRMGFMWYLFSVLTLVTNCRGIVSPEEFMKTAFHIKSTVEFFDNWVRLNGSRINITSLQSQGGDSERMLVGGEELEMAAYDTCSPRPTTHYFGGDNPDPYIMYWPPCTRTNKCGGCCSNDMMTCVPVQLSITPVQAAKTRLPSPGSPFFEYEGMETQLVEEHIRCEPRCAVQPSDCNMLQEFSELDCKCLCRAYVSCDSNYQIFDDTLCQCRCRVETTCTGAHTIFDKNECRCRVMTLHEISEVLLAGGLTSDELQELVGGNRAQSTVSKSTYTTNTTSTTTTTTTTTPQPPTTTKATTTTPRPTTTSTAATTTQPTTVKPTTQPTTTTTRPLSPEETCARMPCRVNQTPVLLSNGLCHCMLNFFNSISLHNLGGLRFRREVLRRRRSARPNH